MKKLLSILTIFCMAFMAAGCNDDNSSGQTNDNTANEESSNNTSNSYQDTNNETNTNATETKNDIPFNEFSLEVKYTNNKEYEADYEYENNTVDASIEDDLNNKRVTGDDAESQLRDILKSLDIDAQTSEDDVISKVISSFDVADDYQEIDVDITFTDGTEKEYRKTK